MLTAQSEGKPDNSTKSIIWGFLEKYKNLFKVGSWVINNLGWDFFALLSVILIPTYFHTVFLVAVVVVFNKIYVETEKKRENSPIKIDQIKRPKDV